MDKDGFLSDQDFRALVLSMAASLNGLCAFQIDRVLREVSRVTAMGAKFSTDSLAYRANLGATSDSSSGVQ
jgi:hypothetical protein